MPQPLRGQQGKFPQVWRLESLNRAVFFAEVAKNGLSCSETGRIIFCVFISRKSSSITRSSNSVSPPFPLCLKRKGASLVSPGRNFSSSTLPFSRNTSSPERFLRIATVFSDVPSPVFFNFMLSTMVSSSSAMAVPVAFASESPVVHYFVVMGVDGTLVRHGFYEQVLFRKGFVSRNS